MATTKNPQSKSINQKRGPTTGNGGNTAKRSEFLRAKDENNSERSKLADFVISALGRRAPDDYVDPRVEPLDSNRGPKANPTAGGTKYNVKARKPGKITK